MLAPLADGVSRIRGLSDGADVEATAAAMRALGAELGPTPNPGEWLQVEGPTHLTAPVGTIDCGNSGTTARLLLGLLTGLSVTAKLDGDSSLRRRPMARVVDPLRRAGAEFNELGEPGRLPMAISGGALKPIEHRSEVASAQVKSALLLAGLTAGVPVSLIEPGPSRDHTERMLRAMDVGVRSERLGASRHVSLEAGVDRLRPLELTVPGDVSSAAFLLALATLSEGGRGGGGASLRIEGVGLNPGRTGFLDMMKAMGADIESTVTGESGDEPVGEIVARPSSLVGAELPPEWVPTLLDELPILACLAARAVGKTTVRGAGELRVKESDRIAILCRNLSSLGVTVEEYADGFAIMGSEMPLRGRIVTAGDHRMAMAFGVLSVLPRNEIEIDDRVCAEVSYPGFWKDLDRVAAGEGSG